LQEKRQTTTSHPRRPGVLNEGRTKERGIFECGTKCKVPDGASKRKLIEKGGELKLTGWPAGIRVKN